MKIISINNLICYLISSILFLILFTLIEKKFGLLSTFLKYIESKCSFHIFVAIFIFSSGIILGFITSFFNLSSIAYTIIISVFVSLIGSLVNLNEKL